MPSAASGAVAHAAAAEPAGRRVQVRGDLDKASVVRAAEGLELAFRIGYRDASLPVRYQGVVPDTFEMAEQVTVGGYVGADGVFQADVLFVQCPSKYEALPPGAATGGAPVLNG
jgi:cytochrome c-type biogenesis protein CcmE